MNFTEYYSAVILREILKRINSSMKKKEKRTKKLMKMPLDSKTRRSQKYWFAQRDLEFEIKEIEEYFHQLYELDKQTKWSKHLTFDQYNFTEKYHEIINEYFDKKKMK
ncbi:DUF1140 family protein [Listeria sp. ILCC792]|uniref:DUF1140 family protein n=1 Tax=Listeria sp. ILCC792 TaxID=1918331 RepID=UPI000B58FD55|nr:DUF1140 family protein [Listeria sp. ILCC792]